MNNNTIDICNELHQNFIDFAYEANSQRAFPDARDGLKPGQRACLWEMYTKGFSSNKPHVKSAKIDGGVCATWWPHGTVAIYETFARMSQPWINNIPEVDWHGSNGNQVIGSAPAADRYTEAKLSKAAEDGMLQGLKKNVVPMILNFSEDEEWPEVLPAIMPRLLINGSQGIGVTIANTWLNMNLTEVVEVIKKYLETNEVDTKSYLIDFPSGGIILNKDDLHVIHETGKGKVILRAKTEIKDNTIIISELPYQVYVEPLLDSIKSLIEKDEIIGIKELYNKSDKKRLLIEIECEKNVAPLKILNQLYKATDLQKTYNANQWALVGKTPKLLTLKNYLDIYIEHNLNCIKKEYEFDLNKAKNRLEIVSGLIKALEDIDNIIQLIKQSDSSTDAKDNLIKKYQFTENQAKAIVDMKLGRLSHLEKVELNKEEEELTSNIEKWIEIISNTVQLKSIFLDRLTNFSNKYGTPRKTQLMQINDKDEDKEILNVEPEKCVVVMTEGGTIKRIPSSSFKAQRRNGKGVKTQTDITSATIKTNTVDSLMIFSNKGKMYRLLVDNIPVGTNTSKGTAIKSLVSMEANEQPTIIYSIHRDTDAKYVLFITKNGLAKKTSLDEYIKTKKTSGISAINLKDGDALETVTLINDEQLILVTAKGYVIKINSTDISPTSRTTMGMKGITLGQDDKVVAALPIRDNNDLLTIFSSNGLGKKIPLSEFLTQKRGGKGIIGYKTGENAGMVSCATLANDNDKILVVGTNKSICIEASDVPICSRTAVGVQIIKDNHITSVTKV
jgi:DNA gyrase subunit A